MREVVDVETPYIIDDRDGGRFKVARETFTSQEVFEKERDLIFQNCWLYLGHESELKEASAFVARTVADQNILFVRGRDNVIRALFNVCPHRGSTVCREKRGKAKTFQCMYHGWVFKNTGELAHLSGENAYSKDFKESEDSNLRPVPRMEQYAGFYFICFNKDVEPLEDYLAGSKEYLDVVAAQSSEGMEIIGGTQEYSIQANWKLLVENSVDGYHAESTHATYLDYLMNTNGGLTATRLAGKGYDLGNGHAVIEYSAPWGRPVAQWIPMWGEDGKKEIDQVYDELVGRVGAETAEKIATKNRNMIIFPNLVVNDIMAITVRTFYPTSPNSMMVNGFAMGVVGESDWRREYRLSNFLEFIGPGGFATPDDVEALEQCQNGFKSAANAPWNDISKGMKAAVPSFDDELQMRAFWREWNRRISELEEK